jgi:hypothetical protein
MGISTYHDSALADAKSDPFFLELYNVFHPLHIAYKTSYDIWKSQGGQQQSETLNFSQLLSLLSNTKIQLWDIQIQNQYPQNTPGYKKLLPNHRVPFQSGGQTERVHAVKALSNAIGTDAKLTAVKTDVDAFDTLLDAAISDQKGSLRATKNLSSTLESARVTMCIGQYANLGALIQKFAASPDKIAQYFDLKAIRNSQQVIFSGQLKAAQVYTIVKHTFGESDQIILTNTGTTQLKFYLGATKDAQPGTAGVTVAGKGEQTVLASAIGKLTDTYFIVQNTDALYGGEFEVELV